MLVMSQPSVGTFKEQIDNYYNSIDGNCSAREYAERLYAVIGIKCQNRVLERYRQPLYLDVKSFITQHLKSFDIEDYGYDIPNNNKILIAIQSLSMKEQLAMYRYANKLYEDCGYETDFLDEKINKLRMCIAWNEHRYGAFLLRLSAYNVWTLLFSYLLFLVIVFLILLPAPYDWMSVLQIDSYDFGFGSLKNHLMNTLALFTDGDYSPDVTPCGLRGLLLVILGKITFYLLIGNFIVKKLSDFFSFE